MASTAIMYNQLCRGALLLSFCASLFVFARPFVVSSQVILAPKPVAGNVTCQLATGLTAHQHTSSKCLQSACSNESSTHLRLHMIM